MHKFLLSIVAFATSILSFGQANTTAKPKNISFLIKVGEWQLVEYQNAPQSKKERLLTDCDTSVRWRFYTDQSTKKNMVTCQSVDGCEEYGFESDWVLKGDVLNIRRTKIMGKGGVSASGSFKVLELSSTRMVLEFQKNKYIFKRQ